MKECLSCGKILSLKKFNEGYNDEYSDVCKDCEKENDYMDEEEREGWEDIIEKLNKDG